METCFGHNIIFFLKIIVTFSLRIVFISDIRYTILILLHAIETLYHAILNFYLPIACYNVSSEKKSEL